MAHPQIAWFARLANKSDTPVRVIEGQTTKLSRTMHDIRYDALHDEFIVGNPFAQAVLTFAGSASGQVAPLRVIQGPSTQLIKPDNLELDPVHDEIIVPEPESNSILVYPRLGQGDVAPIRVLKGNKNNWSAGAVAVDPIHNVIVAAGEYRRGNEKFHALMVFDRTADGEQAPRAVIGGPKSGLRSTRQIMIYPEAGYIIVSHPGRGGGEKPENIYIGVWSVNDNGDVPPRWKIGGPATGMANPRGVALDVKHKEVIVADMGLNAVHTFAFPELFEPQSAETVASR